jgi:hypothetical protein
MRMRSLVAAAVLGAATLFSSIPPASATTEIAGDPNGDSTNPYADIISVGGTYNETAIALSANTVLAADPAYWDDANVIIWDIDTNGDGVEDFSVFYDNSSNRVRRSSDFSLLCYGAEGYDGDLYITAFSASCIGSPSGFRVRAYMKIFTGAYDFAPSHDTFTPWIYRDAPATPTPPPTQPPTPDPTLNTATGPTGPGYWMLAEDGTISNFGGARKHGTGQFVLDPKAFPPFVDVEPTPSGIGYWTLEAGGAIRAYGDAASFPGGHALPPGDRYVSMSVTPDGAGLWLFTARGRVATRGNAGFFGDMATPSSPGRPATSH